MGTALATRTIATAQQRQPTQSLYTSPCCTWIQDGDCSSFDLKMWRMSVGMKNGMQRTIPNTMRPTTPSHPVVKIIPPRKGSQPYIDEIRTEIRTNINTSPMINEFRRYGAVTFMRAVSRVAMVSKLSRRWISISDGIICERLSGKSLQDMLSCNPTQNFPVPTEQFFGINCLIISGTSPTIPMIDVAAAPATFRNRVATSGI